MSLATIFLLAVALGLDAFSVAIGIGAASCRRRKSAKKTVGENFAVRDKALSHPQNGVVQPADSESLRFFKSDFTADNSLAPVWRLSIAFGLFQFTMPLIGWLAGSTVAEIIAVFDHWIAFALLVLIGGKMIWEGCGKESAAEKKDQTRGWPLLLLSIATSIDALAVGFSFSLLKVSILLPAVVIGLVCFGMTLTGMIFGQGLEKLFGKKVEIFGGLVLFAIGVKIMFEHSI